MKRYLSHGGAVLAHRLVTEDNADHALLAVDALESAHGSSIDVRAALCAVPVVMLTSSADERDVCRSFGFGSNGFVTKPVCGTALRSLVAQIPPYWFGVNTPPCVEVQT